RRVRNRYPVELLRPGFAGIDWNDANVGAAGCGVEWILAPQPADADDGGGFVENLKEGVRLAREQGQLRLQRARTAGWHHAHFESRVGKQRFGYRKHRSERGEDVRAGGVLLDAGLWLAALDLARDAKDRNGFFLRLGMSRCRQQDTQRS